MVKRPFFEMPRVFWNDFVMFSKICVMQCLEMIEISRKGNDKGNERIDVIQSR